MDLSQYEMKDLLLAALKSEVDAKATYLKISDRVDNFMMKDRLKFLAEEEQKHADFFRQLLAQKFPNDPVTLPAVSPVPLPEVKLDDQIPISDVLSMAMQAEKNAHDFYSSLAEYFPEAPEHEFDDAGRKAVSVRKMLLYIASMEMGHYKLLEIEEEKAREMEQFAMVWELTHVGP